MKNDRRRGKGYQHVQNRSQTTYKKRIYDFFGDDLLLNRFFLWKQKSFICITVVLSQ